jgi:hypothetical protein
VEATGSLFSDEELPPRVDRVLDVFNYWVQVHRTVRGAPQTVLTDRRRRLLERTLRDYSFETCIAAINGCALSDFHMGQNSRNKKYNDLELIFRDAQHIERFAGMALEATLRTDFDAPTVEVDW